MKNYLFVILFCFGCASQQIPSVSEEAKEYGAALKLTDQGEAVKAVAAWDKFLNKYPTTKLSASALYQKAYSHELAGQYQSAVNTYRSAIVVWGVKNASDRAQALLRISACYEMMGENAKSMAAIKELESNRSMISKIQKDIEIPARKALLFAKEGNQNEAKKFYAVASKNMNQYLRVSDQKNSVWLAEVLYRLSETDPASSLPDFTAVIQALQINQSYLAKIIEMNIPHWSEKATDRLQSQYKAVVTSIQSHITANEIELIREQEEEQKNRAAKTIDAIEKLATEFLPNSEIFEEKLQAFQQNTKKELEIVLLKQPSGQGLTDEAKARQGIRREKNKDLPKKQVSPTDPNL